MNKLFYILLSIYVFPLCIIFTSCKKNEKEAEEIKTEIKDSAGCKTCDTCRDYTIDEAAIMSDVFHAPLERFAPCFNPLNNNEFIYKRINNAENFGSLVKYNLLTKQEQVLIPNIRVIDHPKWGANGWIVFAAWDRKIYKIRDNGDSLTKITFSLPCIHPEFIDDYKKIFYDVGEGKPEVTGNKIIDLKGNKIDSLKSTEYNYSLGIASSNKKNEIAGCFYFNQEKGLQIYDIVSKTMRTILSYRRTGGDDIWAIDWHPQSNKIYYSKTRDGLYSINADGSGKTFIKRTCDTQMYFGISVSPDGKKILVERTNINDTENKKRVQRSDIYIMNSDGSDERPVF